MTRDTFLSHQGAALRNRITVLDFIRNNEPLSRSDIWRGMHLSRASVTQIIKYLLQRGLVVETGCGESRGGRKPTFLAFNADARRILVYDWHQGGVFLVNMKAVVKAQAKVRVPTGASPEQFAGLLKEAVGRILRRDSAGRGEVLGLGLIMPGPIDAERGVVILSNALKWKNVELRSIVEGRVGIPVRLEADGDSQAIGEYTQGEWRSARCFALLAVEADGIGSVIISNGEVQRGHSYLGGEIGHIPISTRGPLCKCGKRGCIEAYVLEAIAGRPTSWIRDVAPHVGLAAAILINVLDPDVVVLAGRVIEDGGPELVEQVRRCAASQIIAAEMREINIQPAAFGTTAGIRGMCGLFSDRIL